MSAKIFQFPKRSTLDSLKDSGVGSNSTINKTRQRVHIVSQIRPDEFSHPEIVEELAKIALDEKTISLPGGIDITPLGEIRGTQLPILEPTPSERLALVIAAFIKEARIDAYRRDLGYSDNWS